MELHILGPLEVTDGERVIEARAPKQCLILADLALADGREISAERLLGSCGEKTRPAAV
jgi:DNA-binding SARP family transcriptional activator